MTQPTDDELQPILAALNDGRQSIGWSRLKMFRTCIDLILATLQRDDDTYRTHVKIIEQDTDPRPVLDAISRAFAEVFHTTVTTGIDILGAVYEHYGLTSNEFGQYFTPLNLANLMAALQLETLEADHDVTPEDPFRIADPACGSGRLLLAAGRILKRDPESIPVLFCGQDKDPLCARMAAINLALAGLPGYVTHGNSLTLEATTTWKIVPSNGLIQGPIQEINPIPIGPSNASTTPRSPASEQSELSAFHRSDEGESNCRDHSG